MPSSPGPTGGEIQKKDADARSDGDGVDGEGQKMGTKNWRPKEGKKTIAIAVCGKATAPHNLLCPHLMEIHIISSFRGGPRTRQAESGLWMRQGGIRKMK